ncbi:hypothetical protein OG604_09010 [Streptomyces sp. NBC_01231]|nr:hypothetical protein OG604_09010 [Streptomyces sp. NBC_01231]
MTTAPVPAVPRWISDPPASPRGTRPHSWLRAAVRALTLVRDRLLTGVPGWAADPPTVTPSPAPPRSPSPTVYSPEPSRVSVTPSVPEEPAPTG